MNHPQLIACLFSVLGTCRVSAEPKNIDQSKHSVEHHSDHLVAVAAATAAASFESFDVLGVFR